MSRDSVDPLSSRLREGLERLAAALRTQDWRKAPRSGLNPTQTRLVGLLAREAAGRSIGELAANLGTRASTVTDSVRALERKGLVRRRRDGADARVVLVEATPAGKAAARAATTGPIEAAIAALPETDRAALLALLVKLIRSLQVEGAIAPQRLCLTCRYFRPWAHPHSDAPHHCDFVDAAFGDRDLRLDCGDYETAEPARQAATWRAFTTGPAESERMEEETR